MTIQVGDGQANPVFTDVLSQAQALSALNAQVLAQLRGQTTATVQVTAIGTQTLAFEGSTDGTNFYAVTAYPITGGAGVTTTTTTGQWRVDIAGMYQFRVRCSAFTSGSATTSVNCSQGESATTVASSAGQAIASTTAGQVGPLVQGAVTTAAPTYTTAQTDPLSLTTAGALRTDINSIIGTTAVAASAGVLKVGIAGGAAGASIDGAIAAAPPANALQIGIKAATANPANATAGNQVAIMGDRAGRQVVTIGNVRELIGNISNAAIITTTETTIIAAVAAEFHDISHLTMSNTGAATLVTIKDSTAGTTRWVGFIGATTGFVDVNFVPPLMQAAVNTAWTVTCGTTAASLIVSCNFVKNA